MRAIPLLPCLLALTLAAAPARSEDAPEAPKTPAERWVLELNDTSRIVGVPGIDRLKITTAYASLEVRTALIGSIQLSNGGRTAEIDLQNGDQLTGTLETKEIMVKAKFGDVTIPLSMVENMGPENGNDNSVQDGLVLSYSFDVVVNGDDVTDDSGAGNAGEVRGANWEPKGKINGAMGFNGDNQMVLVKNSADLQNQDFTIAAWINRGSKDKVSAHSAQARIFGYGEGGYSFGIGGEGRLFVCKTGGNAITSAQKIGDDAFHHVAVTKEGRKITFYIDGTAFAAGDLADTFVFDTNAAVGARPDNSQDCFLGTIDELRVFNRALTGDEAATLAKAPK